MIDVFTASILFATALLVMRGGLPTGLLRLSAFSIGSASPSRRMRDLTNASGMDITAKEAAAGGVFGLINFIVGAAFLLLFGTFYLPSNLVIAQFGSWIFIGLFASVYAILMIVVLGYFGDNIVQSIFWEIVAWTGIGIIGLMVNFFTLTFFVLTYFAVFLGALAASAISSKM